MNEHKLIDEWLDDHRWIQKTTHPAITYDTLSEAFHVDLNKGCWCEVYGKSRFVSAVKIAEGWPNKSKNISKGKLNENHSRF